MDLSLQMLRIFCKVVEENSFSGAARALKITQPTVSQQISRMETELGGRLFERVGREIHLTKLGRSTHAMAEEILERASDFSESLRKDKSLPSGLVRYAMPESCQWTPHYRKIMSQIKDLPGIRFEISILPNDTIVDSLLKAEYDFGFFAGEKLNSELRFEKFSDEHYSAVSNTKDLFQALKQKRYTGIRLISYPGWDDFFMTWAKSHGIWNEVKQVTPSVRIGSLAGAIHAAQEGAGIAIIPTHCVLNEIESGALSIFNESKGRDAKRPVYLTKRLNEKVPHRVELVMEMLRTAKADLG